MLGRACGAVDYGVDGRETGCLEFFGDEVNDAVEGYAGHDMDEKTGIKLVLLELKNCHQNLPRHLVQGMEDE
jgi:hypothetical protein